MALIVYTPNPELLLASIYKAIDEKKIATWFYDADKDFTHEPAQWRYQAWLRPRIFPGMLQFGLVGRNGVTMTKVIYGMYHGRFVEELLMHFDEAFSNVTATALGALPIDAFKAAPA